MLVTFRIKDTATPLHSKPATVSFSELAALMRKLHSHDAALDVDAGEFAAAPLNFEVNANSLSMAEFTSCFDHRADVISVVEEAQFLGRTLRVSHLAAKVLYALGRGDAGPGELTLESLRQLLQEPRTYDAFCAAKIAPVYDSLTYLAFTDCGEQTPVLEWSQ